MGLDTDGASYGIPPFEAEMRRRLWWQLIMIEYRAAELAGVGKSSLTYTWNTKLPANVNDSDLFPDMKGPLIIRPGSTEMTFVSLRCEIVQFTQQLCQTRGLSAVKEDTIEDFEQRLHREYLDCCDLSIPLQLVSSLMTKLALCRLRMGRPSFLWGLPIDYEQAEKEELFQLS